MVIGYYAAYSTLAVLLAAFFPAMIAASKEYRFSKWYIYSVLLFPIAFIHALLLKKPVHIVNVYTQDKDFPGKRKKKSYPAVSVEEKKIVVSPRYIYSVFFSKLIFGAFVAMVLFAIFRTFVYYTQSLGIACVIFAVMFSSLLAVVEMCRFSRLPMIADEITKRALIILLMSVACSLPLYLLQKLIFENTLPEKYAAFTMFLCTLMSFLAFVFVLMRRQRLYYSVFGKFFDYCSISMMSYAIFAAISLIWLSISNIRNFVYLIAMPMQLFNMDHFSGYISKISSIYSSAFVHLTVEIILLFSGLLCRSFKRKELEHRVEYRSKAFRMSRKPILRRHIPRHLQSMKAIPLHRD